MTAYGHAALEELQDVVRDLKAGDPLAPVTVLVPNNIAGIVARRFLAQGLDEHHRGIAALFPTTAVRLAERLAAPTLHPRRPATAPVVAAAWRLALKDGGVFAPVADHPATVQALVRAGRELRDLDDDSLDAVARSFSLGPDLVRLYRDVCAALAPSWYDETDLLRTATRICLERPERADEAGALVMYLPQSLTGAEAEFVRTLAGSAPLHAVVGLTGDDKADAAVHRTLDRIGLAAPAAPEAPVASRVLTASDADDEVRCVVREVVGRLRTTKAHQVAVLYTAADPYARLLHEHLAAAGITVNGPGTRPVHERAIARAFLELLDLAEDEVPRADLFRVLAAAPMRTPDGTRVPVSRWERISRSAGVVQGTDWDERLRRYVEDQRHRLDAARAGDAPPGVLDGISAHIADAEALRAFAAHLRGELHRGSRLVSWRDLSGWALEFLHALIGEPEELTALPREEQYAAAALQRSLRSLEPLDGFGAAAGLAALRETLGSQLEGALPRAGRFGDGVLVAPVSAAVGLDLDAVFVVGLAEGVFPGRLREDPLLPERAREASAGQLLGSRERVDSSRRHLLAAFAAAPEVIASFPRGDLRTKSRHLPSRWLLPSLRALSGEPGLAATEWESARIDGLTTSPSFAGSLLTTGSPACEQEWRTQAASAGVVLDDAVVDAAQDLLINRGSGRFTRFDGDLTHVADGLPDFADGVRSVAPTALEQYVDCPHSYFIRRLLRIEPVEQPEDLLDISPADLGTLMHEAFDGLVKEYAGRLPGHGEPWSDEQRQRLAEIAADLAERFTAEGRTGHPRLWQRTLARIQADLQAMLAADDVWRAEHRARVVTSELHFGVDGTEPVAIRLPDGTTVLMRGSADKVDVGEDGTLFVTDIKSGSSRKFTGLGPDDPLLGGSKLQLPVYAHAARAAHGDEDTVVEAAYWFVGRHKDRMAVPLNDDVEQLYAETVQTIVSAIRSGLFPARPPRDADVTYVQCRYCNPDGIGYGTGRARWESVRHDPRLSALVALVEPLPSTDDGADA